MAGFGRFGRKQAGSVYAGQSVDLDQALSTLDLLRALGWLVRHEVVWPGRPGQLVEHLLVGPPGVFVLVMETDTSAVDPEAAGPWQPLAAEALAAATDVAAALPGVPVTPVVCFGRAEPFTAVAGSVFLCSLRNVVEVLSHAPVRIDDPTLAAVRQEVADGFHVPGGPAVVAPSPEPSPEPAPAPSPERQPEPSPEPVASKNGWSNGDLYAELGRLDEPGEADAGDALEPPAPVEEHDDTERLAAEQAEADRLEAERAEAERAEAARVEADRAEAARVEAERLAAEEAAREQAAQVEAEEAERAALAEQQRLEEERRTAVAAAAAAPAPEDDERMRKLHEEAERAQKSVEAARERRARLQATRVSPPPVEQPEPTAGTKARPDKAPRRPQGKALVAALVIGVLAVGGLVFREPIGDLTGTVKALFTERAPARLGEQVNVGDTLYHPELRLRAGKPVRLPRRNQVAIPFTVENPSDEAWVLETSSLVLVDRVGLSHGPKASGRIAQGRVLPGRVDVRAQETVEGYLLFDLPRDRGVKELRLSLGPDDAAEGAEDPVVWFSRADQA